MADKLNITRRDFLNGIALGVAAGASLSPLEMLAAAEAKAGYYPPGLSGIRGSHAGSFEVAHAVAQGGVVFDRPSRQTDATYDLVVVGGGISGLAAAKLWRDRSGNDARILVLDNHDDFGGHAKRNEFDIDGQTLIGYGGSMSMESPGLYSADVKALLASIGIDPQRFYEYFDQEYYARHGLKPAIHFSAARYGEAATLPDVLHDWIWSAKRRDVEAVIDHYPLANESKASLLELLYAETDYLAGRTTAAKTALLRSTSYPDFLKQYAGVTAEVATLIRDSSKSLWGFSWESLSALEAFRLGEPGTYGMGLPPPDDPYYTSEEPFIFHFPDGNAGIARALVRDLLPDALPGAGMEDLATARVDYSRLDRANPTRFRLNSTVVDVRHADRQKHVDVTYMRTGAGVERVRARHVILACYNSVVPYICPEVSEAQRAAINASTKTPLTYINVALRNWRAFDRLDCHRIYVPQAGLMHDIRLDYPVSMGDYRFSAGPDSPIVLHCVHSPTGWDPNLDFHAQLRAGRQRMLELTWDDYETTIIAELESALGAGGFDAADIAGITVNRWPHGYSREFVDLYDPPDFVENGPHVAGRASIGRISIANSDSHASAYMDAAIDAAVRAVGEQFPA